MQDDSELLRCYAEEKSEAAFTELVRRHINFVYASALRQAWGNTSLAEDVTQAVFTDLAHKAAALVRHRALVGWLHTATRFSTSKAMRAESRRHAREQEAHAMKERLHESETPADWERLRPVLDGVLGELGDRDRAAILLRFFENKTLAEVGENLSLTETAARSRVDRALEKMRGMLARRGVTSTTAALAIALASQAGVAAPAGLAASVTEAALASATAGGTVAAATFMSIIKISIAALMVATGGAGLWWQHQANVHLQKEVASLRAQTQATALISRTDEPSAERSAGQTASVPPQVPDRLPAADLAAAGMISVETFVNAGRMTPRATLETTYWARRHVELAALAQAVAFDKAGKAKADALFGLLSDDLQKQYKTPEVFAAAMLADLPCPTGIQINGETEQGPDDATLKVSIQNPSGKVSQRTLQYHRYDDGWRAVIPVSLVNAAAIEIMKDPNKIPQPKPAAPAR